VTNKYNFSKNSRAKLVFSKPNKSVLNTINYYFYSFALLVYKTITLFINPIQRRFVVLYSVLLTLNLLSFQALPKLIQSILIYICNLESWAFIFKRVSNYINIYLIRERKYPITHRLWVLYYREKNKYYYELNVKKQFHNEISNFFYLTRIHIKVQNSLVPTGIPHNLYLLYYFNKVCLTNYPYLYWTYDLVYNKYGQNPANSSDSAHLRTHLFFLFFEKTKIFWQSQKKISFTKLTFDTFRGVNFFFLFLLKYKKLTPVKKRKLSKKIVKHPKEKSEHNFYLKNLENTLKVFNETFKIKIFRFKTIQINTVSLFSEINKKKRDVIDFRNDVFIKLKQIFTISWYTKLHNNYNRIKTANIVLYLRSARQFNKGRYSRNRQLYRTGVYWCIWLNIFIVYGLYFYFYKFVFSFGYLWFPLGFLILSIFSSRLYKYRYYNPEQIKIEFKEFNKFLFLLFLKISVKRKFMPWSLSYKIILFTKSYIILLINYIKDKIFGVIEVFLIAFKKTSEDSATKDSATKDSATKDSATKDSATKDSATKDSATKDSATKDSATKI